jgi:uncharacterized membrane protein YoaK (UPF0700 family)
VFQKLPPWVETGAFWLTSIAGAVNAIGLMGFKHQAVSHLTGTTTLLSLSLVEQDWQDSGHLLLILLSFLLGAALSGAMLGDAVLRLGRRYGLALLTEAALLIAAMLCLLRGSDIGHLLASAACGLQNGMVSTYSGAAIRTTHVSGLFTDLGTMLGARLRGHRIDLRKAKLLLLLIAGFLAGGIVGAVAFEAWQFHALALPAAGAAWLALIYGLYWLRFSRTT